MDNSHNGLVNVAGETGDLDGAIDSVDSGALSDGRRQISTVQMLCKPGMSHSG